MIHKLAIITVLALTACSAKAPLSSEVVRSEMARNQEASYIDGLGGTLKWNYTTGLELKAMLDASRSFGKAQDDIVSYVDAWYDAVIAEDGTIGGKYKKSLNMQDPSLDLQEIKTFLRPVLVSLRSCENVLLEGVTFQNSPSWNVHPLWCRNVTIRNITIRSPHYSTNGDGIDIDGCENVVLPGSTFDVGDDAICIKSGKDADGRRYTKTDFSSTQMAELSGLCFSKDGDFMWGVGDGGTLYKIGFDMSVTVQMTPTQTSEADLEGVTMDPVTKDLYFCCEPDRIRKTTAPNYNTITKIIEVTEAAEMGNSGLEGITYYKDNVIYTGSQYGANLWAYNLNGTKLWKKALGSIAFEIQEVGDLYYDAQTDLLWVSDSEAFKIFVFDGAVTTLKAMYNISFIGNPEAILVDHARSCVWVGDDRGSSSRIYKISFTDL